MFGTFRNLKRISFFGNLGVKRFHYHSAKWDSESCFRSTCGDERYQEKQQGSTAVGTAAVVSEADKVAEMSRLWHMRLGHAGEKSLQTLAMQGLLKGAKTCKLDFCEQCVLGKQKRVKFGTAIHNTEGILDYIHTDVWGPT